MSTEWTGIAQWRYLSKVHLIEDDLIWVLDSPESCYKSGNGDEKKGKLEVPFRLLDGLVPGRGRRRHRSIRLGLEIYAILLILVGFPLANALGSWARHGVSIGGRE